VAGLLVLAVFLAYAPALSAGFVYDDLRLVRANPNTASLRAALRAFFEPLWAFERQDFENAFWRPLTVLALALVRTLSGQEPAGFHLFAVAVHALAALAAWRLAARLTQSEVLAGAVGLVFALHPVHVESVAWISAVNDPLYGLFGLLALSAHLAWWERGARGVPLASAAWLLLALLCKEQALALLPMMLVLDLVLGRLRVGPGEDPFALLGRAYGAGVSALALYYVGRVIAYDGELAAGLDKVAAGFGLPWRRALGFRLEMLGTFLQLLFVPFDQAVFRMVRAELPDPYPPWTRAWIATALWLGALGWAARARSRRALALLLVIPASFVLLLARYESAGAFPISDRYLYLPVVFAGALAAWALAKRLGRENAAAIVALAALGLGVKSFRYARQFRDEETFFRAAVAASPDLPYVRWGLGRVLLDKYDALREREILDEAAFHFLMAQKLGTDYGEYEQAIADQLTPDKSWFERVRALGQLVNGTPAEGRRPDDTVTWTIHDRLQANMGMGWCALHLAQIGKEHDYDWPLTIFRDSALMAPRDPKPRMGVGTVLMQMGRPEEAEKELLAAIELDRNFPEAWHNLAQCYRLQKRWDEARSAYGESLRMRPGNVDDLIGIVESATEANRHDLAQRELDEALRQHPENIDLSYLRGVLAAKRGDFQGALAAFDRVLARQPDYPMAHLNRGKVHLSLGNVEEATAALGRACELMPESFDAHYSMTTLLLQLGEQAAAGEYLRRAYFLSPPNESRVLLHEQVVNQVGDDRGGLAVLARADRNRGDLVHALDFAERALAVALADPAPPRAELGALNLLRGQLLAGIDRPGEAAEAYADSLRADPDSFRALHDLAVLYAYTLKDRERARPFAARALEHFDQVAQTPEDQQKAMRAVLTSIRDG